MRVAITLLHLLATSGFSMNLAQGGVITQAVLFGSKDQRKATKIHVSIELEDESKLEYEVENPKPNVSLTATELTMDVNVPFSSGKEFYNIIYDKFCAHEMTAGNVSHFLSCWKDHAQEVGPCVVSEPFDVRLRPVRVLITYGPALSGEKKTAEIDCLF